MTSAVEVAIVAVAVTAALTSAGAAVVVVAVATMTTAWQQWWCPQRWQWQQQQWWRHQQRWRQRQHDSRGGDVGGNGNGNDGSGSGDNYNYDGDSNGNNDDGGGDFSLEIQEVHKTNNTTMTPWTELLKTWNILPIICAYPHTPSNGNTFTIGTGKVWVQIIDHVDQQRINSSVLLWCSKMR